MKPIQNVKLAFHCGENLEQMLPCEGGKYCGVCNKKVIDFTKSTQEEFNQAIAESGAVCGMFSVEQLAPQRSVNHSSWRKFAASLFIALGFSSMSKELLAQNNPKNTANPVLKTQTDINNSAPLVFGGPEVIPVYKYGGDSGFGKFLSKNLKNYDNVEGRVIVSFLVDTGGVPQDIKILRGLSKVIDKEVIRVIKLAEFKPPLLNGKKVASNYTCPVSFKKEQESK